MKIRIKISVGVIKNNVVIGYDKRLIGNPGTDLKINWGLESN